MYAGVDIGGTKTLVAMFDAKGRLTAPPTRFGTPQSYRDFLQALRRAVGSLQPPAVAACCVAVPGEIDRQLGIGKDMGNLASWTDIPIQADIRDIIHCPTVIENDANLGGLSEAKLLPTDKKVLYLTISTGIGTGFIDHHQIVPDLADSEGGQMLLEHHGKLVKWESFASGRAIVERFGKRAEDIHDEATWQRIAHDLSLGLIELMAIGQPDVVVFGGSVSNCFERFGPYLELELKRYENPLIKIPELRKAARPDDAVLYGCYELAKTRYGRAA